MKKTFTAGERTNDRTTFRFNDDEVATALAQYAQRAGEIVPDGERAVWVRDHITCKEDEPLLTLVVDTPVEVVEVER